MVTLEKYKTMRSRHTCPACGIERVFVRYVTESGDYISDDVGRCNRETRCGYHYPPREYFIDNPDSSKRAKRATKEAPILRRRDAEKPKIETRVPVCFHTRTHLESSLGFNQKNPFYSFLINLFPDSIEQVEQIAKDYFLGYFHGLTCFWQIDRRGRIRKGKLMRYAPTCGKRQLVYSWKGKSGKQVELGSYWVHRVLQKRKEMPEDLILESCFFGEHLLRDKIRRDQTVCIVEAEKTALICAIARPDFLWLAAGAQSHLQPGRMTVLKDRKIILYPDSDCFDVWKEKEREADLNGYNIRTSEFLKRHTSATEKENGFDLADWIIRERKITNEFGEY